MMTDAENNESVPREFGDIGVSNEVFETIAVTCARRINGVAGMESADGLVDSLSKVWGRSDAPKGVKVATGDDDVSIDMTVILKEGYAIPQVAGAIQREVKSIVEDMTGHAVKAVNILVADLQPEAVEAQIVAPDEEEK
ncbi:MAG: Asp23/Gls24 family envelope stress response protein [Candidatus Omnitrophota bacterium]